MGARKIVPFDGNVAVETLTFSDLAGVVLSSCFTCEFLLLLRLFHFYILLSRFRAVFQVVFRASFVSRREAIIDLYAAMLKDMGVALDAESPTVPKKTKIC